MNGTKGVTTKHQLDDSSSTKKLAKKSKGEVEKVPVPPDFKLLDRYWKASNYLAVGQVSLGLARLNLGECN